MEETVWKSDMAGGRRDDPNFSQVSGYIPKEVALQFKATCTLVEISQTDALEEAIRLWLEKVKSEGKVRITP